MKNTDKIYQIKRGLKRFGIGSGLYLTSLFMIVPSAYGRPVKPDIVEDKGVIFDDDGYLSYDDVYERFYNAIDESQFDANFVDAYNDIDTIVIDGVSYKVNDLIARYVIGGGAVIVEDLALKFDIIDKKRVDVICDGFCAFKDASFFLDMYKDNIIEDNQIVVTGDKLKGYLANWDGSIHTDVRSTLATSQTKNYVIKRDLGR